MRNGEVRLLGEDGMQLGVMSMAEALRRAEEANLALVAVQSGADPPVYRLMDDYSYECHRREQERRAYERQKVQEIVGLKEVRWRPMADAHELDTKRRAIRTWLAEGATVRLTVRMRGRELAHPDAAPRHTPEHDRLSRRRGPRRARRAG